MTPALEQLARVERYLARLERQGPTDEDYDDLLSFFMHAWHLADWAANDPSIGRGLADVQADAKQFPSIAKCADFADGIKHFKLTRPPREYPKPTHKIIVAYEGTDEGATAMHILTLPDGSPYNALALAREVVREWEVLLTRYGVLT